MKIAANTPTRAITCQGINLRVPSPYTEGHTITPNEASVLNQTLAENLRNNFASKASETVKAAGGDAGKVNVAELQAAFNKYVEEYEFGVHRSGVRVVDPIDREALAMATEAVKSALRQRNIKVADVEKSKMQELISTYAAREDVRKEAARRVKNAGQIGLEDLGL